MRMASERWHHAQDKMQLFSVAQACGALGEWKVLPSRPGPEPFTRLRRNRTQDVQTKDAHQLQAHKSQGFLGGALFGLFFAFAGAAADDVAVEVDFHGEGFIVVGAVFVHQFIGDFLFPVALDRKSVV